jgi:hypothetical protein
MYNITDMEINKAKWSTKDSNIRLSMPINKVDKERRTVSGFATLDNLDKQGDIVPSEASVKAFERFRGNVREMHQPIAVGKIVSFKEDKYFDQEEQKLYNGIYVSAYVSKGAQDTWEKVLDGTLTGFSIGGEINDADDIYDEEMNKSYRVIKDYSLSELSLVDNPANQFANVLSIEKSFDGNHLNGYLSKATIENVFWCRKDDVISMAYEENRVCPQCDKAMSNIGFVESNDTEKSSVVRSIVLEVKKGIIQNDIDNGYFVKFDGKYGKVYDVVMRGGVKMSSQDDILMAKSNDPIAIIKVYSENDGTIVPTNRRVIKNISSLEKVNAISKSEVKEVSKMDSDIIVVDEIEKSADVAEEQVSPEPTDVPVAEEVAKADKPADAVAEDSEAEKGMYPKKAEDEEDEEETMKADMPEEKKENETEKMISEISESLTSALSTLAETVKALDAKIEGVNKAVAGISSEVESVKDSFGKRVDAVEKDTAFRKSADLGEILQEEPVIVEKSTTWGGRFLTNADLFK